MAIWTVLPAHATRVMSIFGLGVQFHGPLAGLQSVPARDRVDIHVFSSDAETSEFESLVESLEWVTTYQSMAVDPNGLPALMLDADAAQSWLRMRYSDRTEFVLDRSGSTIYCSWKYPSTFEDAATYLLGPVMGHLLYRRGLTCLHASAIAFESRALVFIGPAEAGKSTLAAAFGSRGHQILTDDILVLAQQAELTFAVPGVPRVGLWERSVELLYGAADALPRQTPNWGKRYIDLVTHGLYQDTPLPIGAVYVLAERAPNAAVLAEPLSGVDAALALVANKYATRVTELDQERRDFRVLSKLAASVPIRTLMRSDALHDLSMTCEAILSDFASLHSTTV